MTKVTIASLEADLAAAQARISELESATHEPQRGVSLEGLMKFWKQPVDPATNQPRNYYEFVIANSVTRGEGANAKTIELPFDNCRVTTARPELIQQLTELVNSTRYRRVRVHGAWMDNGQVTMNRGGYLRCAGKVFFVTRFEVLSSAPIEEPAAEPQLPIQQDANLLAQPEELAHDLIPA